MAPTDKLHLPFRWSFLPEQDARDGSIRWHLVKPVEPRELVRVLGERGGTSLR